MQILITMFNRIITIAFILILPAVCSFRNIKNEKSEKNDVTTSPVNQNHILTDKEASFLAGMNYGENACLSKLDSTIHWKQYASQLDSLFVHADSLRLKKMKVWADSEIVRNEDKKTVFYPFSGPDFLNAHLFYPDADRYIMIGLEPIGNLPDICNMIPDSVKSYLNSVNNSMTDIFKRSYFITATMDKDLRKTKVNGTIPLISLFIKRTGHQIIDMQRVCVDSTGQVKNIDDYKKVKNSVPGIRIDFSSSDSGKIQSLYYFRTDLSDKGLKRNSGFVKYLSELPESNAYLKAASYLMHYDEFKIIRNTVFSVSSTILQDDSGIAYKYFDQSAWNIKLYGKYFKPKGEFNYISEPDLEKAYKQTAVKPLTYTVGYNWRTDHSNLLYATKKQDNSLQR
jgi:hypothetical protein